MNICIVGTGYVGLVTGTIFAHKGHNVICIDKEEDKVNMLKEGRMPIYEPGLDKLVEENVRAGRLNFSTDIEAGVTSSQIIFIAVGTPPSEDGRADLSYIEQVARQVARHMNEYKIIVEKSTVPVQTGEKVKTTIEMNVRSKIEFDVVSNPEFLKEGSAIEDALHPDRIVIGVSSERARKVMEDLYKDFNAPIITTDVKSAEIIKHAANSFLALKISYINAVANVCELAGANVMEVAEGMGLDKRIGRNFLNAGLGYGGSCFPKDIDAFARISEELGYDFPILKEVQQINYDQRKMFVKKIEQELWIVKRKTIGVLGLAFKPNTDDMREAPAIYIINELQKRGANIKAYDPEAMDNAKQILDKVEYCQDPYSVAKGVDCLVIATEWEEFKLLDLKRIKKEMNQPNIIDGRNIFDPAKMIELGFNYRSIGR
ncbi:MAG: UDP-glucose/GDP-mannose dehydrogenase family protein [Planctomycetota bacterium]